MVETLGPRLGSTAGSCLLRCGARGAEAERLAVGNAGGLRARGEEIARAFPARHYLLLTVEGP